MGSQIERFKRYDFDSTAMKKFLSSISALSPGTQSAYKSKLRRLPDYALAAYGKSLDEVVADLLEKKLDPFDFLNGYMAHIWNMPQKVTPGYLRHCVKSARIFLEICGMEISDRTFAARLRFPRNIEYDLYAIGRQEIRELVLGCPKAGLRTFLILLSATGMRPIEACSIRHQDIDMKSDPVKLNIRAQYTKMRRARYVYLTFECAKAVKDWLHYKHRVRPVVDKYGKRIVVKPEYRADDLLFAPYRRAETRRLTKVDSIYGEYLEAFSALLVSLGKNQKADYAKRNLITFYSLRRWIKSTLADLGYSDFSEWMIGHKGSTYYRRKEQERIDTFRKVEEHLIILDYQALDVRQRDSEARLQALSENNTELRRTVDKLMADRDTLAKDLFERLKKEFMQELENRLR